MSTEISKWVPGSPNYENLLGNMKNTEGFEELASVTHTMRIRLLIPDEIIDNMLYKDVKKLKSVVQKYFSGFNNAAIDHISNLCYRNIDWFVKYIDKNIVLEIAPAGETLNRTK